MRKIKTIFLTVIFSLLFVQAWADVIQDKTISPIQDNAEILTSSEYASLFQMSNSLINNYCFGFYIVTVDSMEDFGYYSIEDFSEYIYNYYDFGYGSDRDGVMLILSMEDRDYDICAHGAMGHRTFTDYGKDKLAKNSFLPYFKNDNWAEGFEAFLIKAAEYYEYSDEGEPVDVNSSHSSSSISFQEFLPSIGIAFLIALVIGLVVCFAIRSTMKSVKLAKAANDYIDKKSVGFTERSDMFTHRDVVRHKIEKPSNHSSGGTSISSGGFSHSSGKF